MWNPFYLFIALCLLIYIYFLKSFNYWKSRGFPYIKPTIPFGNLRKYALLQISLGDSLEEIYNSTTAPYVGFWIFGKPCLLLRSPEIIKKVLATDFNYFCDRTLTSDENSDPLSANLLLTQRNPKWKNTRQNSTRLFTTGRLKGLTPLMEKTANDMIKYIKRMKELEVRDLGARYTSDTIASSVFGLDADSFADELSILNKHTKHLFEPNLNNGLRLGAYYFLPILVKLFKIQLLQPNSTKFFERILWETIAHRQTTGQTRNDIIDMFVTNIKKSKENGEEIDRMEVLGLAIQMYSAGYETGSAAISFTLYLLSMHPHIQEKVREEVNIFFNKNQCIDYENSKSLKNLNNIIDEALRMFSPLDLLDRRCVADYKLPDSDLIIEEGTSVFIPTKGLHYDANLFPNPTKFDPDRFSEENIHNIKYGTYLPFGDGPRHCVGKILGKLSVKICLAYILREFRIETTEETQEEIKIVPGSLVMHAKGGIKLRFVELNK